MEVDDVKCSPSVLENALYRRRRRRRTGIRKGRENRRRKSRETIGLFVYLNNRGRLFIFIVICQKLYLDGK